MDLSRKGQLAFGWIAVALLPIAGSIANEHHDPVHHLEGDYGLTTVSECLLTTPHASSVVGIDPTTLKLLLPTITTTQSGAVVMHFFRDGRVQFSGQAAEVDLSELEVGHTPSIPGLPLSCSGTHSVSTGNKLTLMAACTVVEPQSGVRFTVSPVHAEGTFSTSHDVIELDETAALQKVEFAFPNGSSQLSERVCTQRFSLVKLP